MSKYLFIISILATWRITSLLVVENGPFDIFFKLRLRSRKSGELMDCFLCLSIWVALPLSFLFPYWYIHWFALSAGAIALEKVYDWLDNQ